MEIVGILGAGKTTLLQNINHVIGNDVSCLFEDLSTINDIWSIVNNDGNPKNYYLLISAYYLEFCSRVVNETSSNKIIITDSSLSVHHYVYAYYCWKNELINNVEWVTLSQMFNFFLSLLPPLAGVFEIDVLPLKASENLQLRNRDIDKKTSLDYILKIYNYLQINRNHIVNGVPAIIVKPEENIDFNAETKRRIKELVDNVK